MRQSFSGISSLMLYYEAMKFKLISVPTVLPSHIQVQAGNAMATQSKREELLCFVGEVEMFIMAYYAKQRCREAEKKYCVRCKSYDCNTYQPKGYLPIPPDALQEVFDFTFAPYYWLYNRFPEATAVTSKALRNNHDAWNEHFEKYHTLGQLRKIFQTRLYRGVSLPRRLLYLQHLSGLKKDMISYANDFFRHSLICYIKKD